MRRLLLSCLVVSFFVAPVWADSPPTVPKGDPLRLPRPATAARIEMTLDQRPAAAKIVPRLQLEMMSTTGEMIPVLVTLTLPVVVDAKAEAFDDETLARHHAIVEHDFVTQAEGLGFRARRGLRNVPVVIGEVPRGAIESLASMPTVRAVEFDFPLVAQRTEGGALMSSPALRNQGGGGDGIGVAILDTGIDWNHAELPSGSKVTAGGDYTDTQTENEGLDDEGHGTGVAGIVAGLNGGMAPEAHLWAMKVLDDTGSGSFSYSVAALDDVYTNRDSYGGVHVVNMSLGGGAPIDYVCDLEAPSMTPVMEKLVNAGISIFVASSNDGCSDGIGFPACISHAIAVGAVYDADIGSATFTDVSCVGAVCIDNPTSADKITCYSNSGNYLDILAPSHCSTTTRKGGGFESCFGGTSAACPYAAGVAAQIVSKRPSTTPSQLREALTSTGTPITDDRNGITRPRIDALEASNYLAGGNTGPAYSYWVATVAGAEGKNDSFWKSNVGTLNRGSQPANLAFKFYTGGQVKTATSDPLPAGAQGVLLDVVGQFQLASAAGAFKVESDQPLFVTSRTFNEVEVGVVTAASPTDLAGTLHFAEANASLASTETFGQYLDGHEASGGLGAGESAWLPQLTQNVDFRTNIGVTNMGSAAAVVSVTLYRPNGTPVGTYQVNLAEGQWKQDPEPFRERYGLTNILGGYAKVTVVSGSGVITYASVVDNNSNDPTTIPMKR